MLRTPHNKDSNLTVTPLACAGVAQERVTGTRSWGRLTQVATDINGDGRVDAVYRCPWSDPCGFGFYDSKRQLTEYRHDLNFDGLWDIVFVARGDGASSAKVWSPDRGRAIESIVSREGIYEDLERLELEAGWPARESTVRTYLPPEESQP